jgi:thioredoxin-related protein
MRSNPCLAVATALALWGAAGGAVAGPVTATPVPRTNAPRLEWLEYGEALDRGKSENKHILIDFYTSWCGWCKVMDSKTYGDSAVAAYLTSNFVLTKINAESAKPLKVGEANLSGVQIAREYGVQSFPITWFVKPDGARLDRLMGYVPPDKFQRALQYVHERQYEKKAQ